MVVQASIIWTGVEYTLCDVPQRCELESAVVRTAFTPWVCAAVMRPIRDIATQRHGCDRRQGRQQQRSSRAKGAKKA